MRIAALREQLEMQTVVIALKRDWLGGHPAFTEANDCWCYQRLPATIKALVNLAVTRAFLVAGAGFEPATFGL